MRRKQNEPTSFFPLVIDSTILSEWSACPIKCFRQYIQHFNSEESTDLVAGGAFAKGLEVARKAFYEQKLPQYEAVALGQEALREAYGDHIPFSKSNKTCEAMETALSLYFVEWPMVSDEVQPVLLEDGKYGIEYSFAHELPIMHPVLNVPLIFSGRADMLATYAGKVWVSDEKTTGQIGETWAQQWNTRGQFTGYCWGLRKDGIKVAGALIRGIGIGRQSNKFIQTTSVRSEYECKVWERHMLEKVYQMVNLYTAYLDHPEEPAEAFFMGAWNEACLKYFKPCKFMDTCKSPKGETFLPSQMDQYIWLPHQQKREKLEVFLQEIGYEL